LIYRVSTYLDRREGQKGGNTPYQCFHPQQGKFSPNLGEENTFFWGIAPFWGETFPIKVGEVGGITGFGGISPQVSPYKLYNPASISLADSWRDCKLQEDRVNSRYFEVEVYCIPIMILVIL
jgi:hypothetical protein